MASVAPSERQTVPVGLATARPSTRHDAPDLASFRTLAALNYDRSLSRLVEGEIIPRLMLAHAIEAPPAAHWAVEPEDVDALAALALEVNADALLARVETILARGTPVESMMVDLLAPAARLLGTYWEEDRCDFVEVTMGLWRLQEVVHEIAARVPVDRRIAAGGRRALFATMPGDQHSFGTVVIDELFRRNGWVTDRLIDAPTPELLRRTSDNWFDVIGLTVSCDCHIAPLPSIIAAECVAKSARLCVDRRTGLCGRSRTCRKGGRRRHRSRCQACLEGGCRPRPRAREGGSRL